jgi:hypothetical protein
MNDGIGGATNIAVDTANIDNKPYLTSFIVSTGLTTLGNTYKFRIRADNEIGYVTSTDTSIVLAAVPVAPPSIPTQDYSQTSSK